MTCPSHSADKVCPIDKLLLESYRPINFEHFDTSFDQIHQKNVNAASTDMQKSKYKKPQWYPFSEETESGVSLGLTVMFILGLFVLH